MPKAQVEFTELRDDWYRGAEVMARLIAQSSLGAPMLVGFPAQWAPVFEHFGAIWSDPIPPPAYVPMVSDLEPAVFAAAIEGARRQGRLRQLVEGIAVFDPLVADVLHRLDRRPEMQGREQGAYIPLSGWQSYGRPELLAFAERVETTAFQSSTTAILLPCARRRPYRGSKTHKRLHAGLEEMCVENADEIVVSSLGVVPSAHWEDPIVLAYDSGVPDIYRVLRLMRSYFRKVRYDQIIDCLEFEPYRDCLRIIHGEGLVGDIRPGPGRKVKALPRP